MSQLCTIRTSSVDTIAVYGSEEPYTIHHGEQSTDNMASNEADFQYIQDSRPIEDFKENWNFQCIRITSSYLRFFKISSRIHKGCVMKKQL